MACTARYTSVAYENAFLWIVCGLYHMGFVLQMFSSFLCKPCFQTIPVFSCGRICNMPFTSRCSFYSNGHACQHLRFMVKHLKLKEKWGMAQLF